MNCNQEIDTKAFLEFQRTRDPSDLSDLLDRHIEKVHGLAFKMTADQTAADDIAQEVFLKVIARASTFAGNSAFSTWLYRITLNSVYSWNDRQKKRSRRQDHESEHGEFQNLQDKNSTNAPYHNAMQHELLSEIERSVASLKPDFRAAIVLTGMQGLSPKDAAQIAGVAPEVFYWRLHQARKHLKQKLGHYLGPTKGES